jgi:hypothetical protein
MRHTPNEFWKPETKPVEAPLLLDVRHAAHMLSVHENTIRNFAKSGKLTPVYLGGEKRNTMMRFKRIDIERLAGVAQPQREGASQ